MGKTVLIVDDEVDVLDSLKDAFEFEGYTVVTAPDGAAALVRLGELNELPCAAVLDVFMPKMTGVELYEAMKLDERLARVSVIFCTSAPASAPRGAMVMKKPIDLDRLVGEVRARCTQ